MRDTRRLGLMPPAEPNVQVTFAAPWRVELVEGPVPRPQAGEALIETRRSLISTGTELTLLSGEGWSPLARPGVSLPAVGYCHVGIVVDVGPGVDRGWIGRRVASRSFHARYAIGRVEPTPDRWRSGLFAIPDDVSDEEATLLALGMTALLGVHRGGMTPGERVAVVGLGLLGQLAVRAALARGASEVRAVGRGAARLAFLPQTEAVRPVACGVEAAQANAGDSDLVLEVTGEASVVGPALELVRKGGRMVLLGSNRGPSTIDLQRLVCEPYRTIIGADILSLPARPAPGDTWCTEAAARLFFEALLPAIRSAPSLVTHRFRAAEAPAAYALLRERSPTTLACTLDWS